MPGVWYLPRWSFLISVSLAQVRICYMFVLIQAAPNRTSPYPTMFSILLVTSCLLSLIYFCCSTITITTFITTTTTTVSQLLLIRLCKQVFISGAIELTTQLLKHVHILWLPKCRINKLGYLAREDYLDPLQLRVITTHLLRFSSWEVTIWILGNWIMNTLPKLGMYEISC